jgi:hypothetical protein
LRAYSTINILIAAEYSSSKSSRPNESPIDKSLVSSLSVIKNDFCGLKLAKDTIRFSCYTSKIVIDSIPFSFDGKLGK